MQRVKKILIALFVLLTIIAAISAFFVLNSKPDGLSQKDKEEAIGKILGRKPNLNPNVKTGNDKYEGKYADFEYPAKAKIYEYRGGMANNTETEIFSFDIENPRLILNYSAEEGRTDLKNLEDIPSVKLRQDKSRGYTQIQIKADGKEGLAFTKRESSEYRAEKSGFFLVDSKAYSFSVTGNNLEDVSKLFDDIIESLVFK